MANGSALSAGDSRDYIAALLAYLGDRDPLEVFAETAEVLRELVARRYPSYDHQQADDRERRRVIQYLQRRGFTLSDILSVLQEG